MTEFECTALIFTTYILQLFVNKLTCNSQWKPNGSSLWGLEFKITNSCESRDQHRKTPLPHSFTARCRLPPVSLFLQKFKGTFYLQIKSKYTHSHIIRCTCSIARSIKYLISQSHGTNSVVKMTSWSWAEHQNEERRWCKWCWTWLAYLPLNISETDNSNEFYLYSDKSQQPVPQSKDPTFTQRIQKTPTIVWHENLKGLRRKVKYTQVKESSQAALSW